MLLLVYTKFKDFPMLEHTLALTSTCCRMPGIRNLRPHMWTSASFSALSVAAGLPAAWLRFPAPDASAPTISTRHSAPCNMTAPRPCLMLQRQKVEPAGGVAGSRTTSSTVQLVPLWPVAQGAECKPLLAASCCCT